MARRFYRPLLLTAQPPNLKTISNIRLGDVLASRGNQPPNRRGNSTFSICGPQQALIGSTYLISKGTTNRRMLSHLRHLAPNAKIVMTADDLAEAGKLVESGASQAVVPGNLTGQRLFEVLRELLPS